MNSMTTAALPLSGFFGSLLASYSRQLLRFGWAGMQSPLRCGSCGVS